MVKIFSLVKLGKKNVREVVEAICVASNAKISKHRDKATDR